MRTKCLTIANILALAATAGFALWFSHVAIIESDYHWHVAAGHLMRSTFAFIRTDPFAWTREGLAYGSNHEWLSQIVFSLVADIGPAAEVLFRGMIIALMTVILLLAGGRAAWLGLPLAVVTLLPSIGGFTDRPQIFTFLLLACSLWTALRYLDTHDRRLLMLFPAIHILWINVHGAAAILNVMIVGALFLQECWIRDKRSIKYIGLTLAVLLPASLLSPMGTENIAYMFQLRTDATVSAIKEWQPRMLATYIKELWPVYAMLVAALIAGRRHLLFAVAILLPLLWLSRQAFRHEMLLSFTVLGIAMHQLRGIFYPYTRHPEEPSTLSRKGAGRLEGRAFYIVATIVIAAMIPLAFQANDKKLGFLQNNYAYGTLRDRVGGAVAFMETNGISLERPFNSYNLGSELDGALEGRGKVFVDGRNIDFGDAFLTPLFAAGATREAWDALEQQYGFTAAIVDYEEAEAGKQVAYVSHLRDNASWVLVYMNDFAAVYVKDIPEHATVIAAHAYRFIDPIGFRRTANPTMETVTGIETELKRMIREDPNGTRPTILLARLYASNGLLGPAEKLLADLVAAHPLDYRPQEELALLLVKAHRFEEAAAGFKRMRYLIGSFDNADIRASIADAFAKEGAIEWAERYR